MNAANSSLLEGADGAKHQAVGPQSLEACRTLKNCKRGEAKMTKGYRLSAKYVIHAVVPIWNGGRRHEAQLLAEAYRNSLRLTTLKKLDSVAFPAISTGVYGYSFTEASKITRSVVPKHL